MALADPGRAGPDPGGDVPGPAGHLPDDARGTALAIRLTGNRLGQVATPAAAGLVAGAAGVAAAFRLLGGVLVMAAATVARRPG
jgi:hypothetical protein